MNRPGGQVVCALALVVLALSCQREVVPSPEAVTCGPPELRADKRSESARPDTASASFSFAGDMPEQVDFVWIQPEGRYHYSERWNWGVSGEDGLQVNLGWDWKHDCRIERCEKPGGVLCCFQVCEEGGDSGVASEPPDRFGCMNEQAGGKFQWFLKGLRDAGVEGLEGCFEPAPRRLLEEHGAQAPGRIPTDPN